MLENKNAGFWIRFLAFIIDSLWIILLSDIVIYMGFGIESYEAQCSMMENYTIETPQWFDILIVGLILAMWVKWKGKTPGKKILGIKIVKVDGSNIGIKEALIRYLGYIVSAFIFLIGFIIIGFREDKRGIHDLMSGTKVVYESAS